MGMVGRWTSAHRSASSSTAECATCRCPPAAPLLPSPPTSSVSFLPPPLQPSSSLLFLPPPTSYSARTCSLWQVPAEFLAKGGTEVAPMSTTSSLAVAMQYAAAPIALGHTCHTPRHCLWSHVPPNPTGLGVTRGMPSSPYRPW